MAQTFAHQRISIPAGTASPGTARLLTTPQGVVDFIEVRIPDGHSGLTGLQVFYNANQVIPQTVDQFLKGNSRTYTFDVDDLPTGNAWTAIAFNTDVHAHAWDITFALNPVPFEEYGVLPPIIMLPYQGDGGEEILAPFDPANGGL